MFDVNDIAKIESAILLADEISYFGTTDSYWYFKNSKNKKANSYLLEKRIGDKSYYVVLAVPITSKRTAYVVSAFIGKSGYKKGLPTRHLLVCRGSI